MSECKLRPADLKLAYELLDSQATEIVRLRDELHQLHIQLKGKQLFEVDDIVQVPGGETKLLRGFRLL